MIVLFSFSNYKTYKERSTLNMLAADSVIDVGKDENIITTENQNFRLLKSSALFGANASGKSNLLDSITFFRKFLLYSSKDSQSIDSIPVDTFKSNEPKIQEPSEFEMIFILDGILYRYGIEADNQVIVAEWLYMRQKKKEIELFYRSEQSFEVNSKKLPKASILLSNGLVRKNALLLSVLAKFNDQIATSILGYFSKMKCTSGSSDISLDIHIALENGSPLIVDDLDFKMHPNLVSTMVSLFHSDATNPKNAQLIFSAHQTNLLSAGLFRRDQIWFIEKNEYGASKLYSLADFVARDIVEGEHVEANYLRGLYGAVPFLPDFENNILRKRSKVELLAKKLDHMTEEWELKNNIQPPYYSNLGKGHFRSKS